MSDRSRTAAGPPLLELRGVGRRYGGVNALEDLDLGIAAGQAVGVIGPNGAGKSTLISLVAGAVPPTSGRVLLGGTDVTAAPAWRMARRGVARTHQVPRPLAGMSVQDNVAVGATFGSSPAGTAGEARSRARAALARVGLGERADAGVEELTDVELRRMELARAIASRPRLVLLDEVFAGQVGADLEAGIELLNALKAEGVGLLLVEHLLAVILAVSDVVVVLAGGREVRRGEPGEVVGDTRVLDAYLGRIPPP